MNPDEIVEALLAALESLDWVQWAKQQMNAARSPVAMATAPPADALAPPEAREQYAARDKDYSHALRDPNFSQHTTVRALALEMCVKAALAGQTPDYGATLANIRGGKLELAMVLQ